MNDQGYRRRDAALVIAGTTVLSAFLYVWTLAPGVLWGDSAELQTRAFVGALESGARGHPLWVVIAHAAVRLLSWSTPAWRANLVSAGAGALTVGVVAGILYHTTRSRVAAFTGAGTLAVSHTFWLHSVITEVYTLHLLFIATAALLLFVRHPLANAVTWLLLGLSVSIHLQTIAVVPAFLVLTLTRHRPRDVVLFVVCGAVGMLPFVYLELTAPALGATGNVLAIGRKLTRAAFWQSSPRFLMLAGAYWGYQFLFSCVAGLVGIYVMCKQYRHRAAFWGLWLVGSAGAAFLQRVPDQYVFYLPTWVAFSVCCGVGYQYIVQKIAGSRRHTVILCAASAIVIIVSPTLTYRTLGTIGSRLNALLPLRFIPYRDTAQYFFWPPKHDDLGARGYIEATFSHLPPDAILVADWTLYTPLLYAQRVEKRRLDIELVDTNRVPDPIPTFLLRQPRDVPLYIAGTNPYYPIDALKQYFEIVPQGPVYALHRRATTDASE